MARHPKSRVVRLDASRATIENECDVPITLYANESVRVESDGIEQLLQVAALQLTLKDIADREKAGTLQTPFWGESPGKIDSIVLTPDFHRGGTIPIGTVIDARGFVIPSAVGNDVCCGMRFLVTDVKHADLERHLPEVKKRLRAVFFQGERNIPMSPKQREAVLRDGLEGIHSTYGDNSKTGMWRFYDPQAQQSDLSKSHFGPGYSAKGIFAFDKFIAASGNQDSRDGQIGSVGGGNHFVEIQLVEEVLDAATAHQWGFSRGNVTIMVHTGSVGLGHMVGGHFGGVAYDAYPKGIPHPEHGFYVLPTRGPHASKAASYLDAMRNASNFALANRLFLGLMAVRAISEATGKSVASNLIYDAPHNLIWEQGDHRFLHRKGATPAMGMEEAGPFAYTGHPVIVPGSMGTSSYLLAGLGNEDALCSACHGAGRLMNRGKSAHVSDDVYEDAVERLHVVTPIDPESHEVKSRQDILSKYHSRMKEEAPYAYKPIDPIIDSIVDSQVARKVARLKPLITVKG